MPWDLQMGESRGAVMDERFNGGVPKQSTWLIIYGVGY